jgi:hypothetical protein
MKKPYSGEPKPVVESYVLPVTIKRVNVQSLMDSRVQYTGRESGKLYEWDKAGAIVSVDEQDVSELLSKRRGKKTCCGNSEQPPIFQIVE